MDTRIMQLSNLNIEILEPNSSENWLTNGDTFSKKVYLGKYDSPDNWTEISNEEKEQKEKELENEITQ